MFRKETSEGCPRLRVRDPLVSCGRKNPILSLWFIHRWKLGESAKIEPFYSIWRRVHVSVQNVNTPSISAVFTKKTSLLPRRVKSSRETDTGNHERKFLRFLRFRIISMIGARFFYAEVNTVLSSRKKFIFEGSKSVPHLLQGIKTWSFGHPLLLLHDKWRKKLGVAFVPGTFTNVISFLARISAIHRL